jgi:segregation and condensation protein A
MDFKIEKFEGPLDLLLQLIEQEELDITEVNIAHVADQFLKYLREAEIKNPDEIADFLVVAAKLIFIKSKSILPGLEDEFEEEGETLEQQLKMYREFVEASRGIDALIQKKNFSFSRQKITAQEGVFFPPKFLTAEKMAKIFNDIISFIKPVLKLPEQAIRKAISIQEKINHIQRIIKEKGSVIFSKVLKDAKDKTEKIVSFLALLELVKQKYVSVGQEKIFDDIEVENIKL